jgi:hypothetical protein
MTFKIGPNKILIRSIANIAAIAAVSTIIALKTAEMERRGMVVAVSPSETPAAVLTRLR